MNALMKTVLATKAGYSTLALRLPIGIIFMAHGAQKLFGWYDGSGLEVTATKWPPKVSSQVC